MKKKHNKPKAYIAIAKVADKADGTAHCVKFRFNNLLKFTIFLDTKWSGWRWYNVFSNRGNDKGNQVANFTNKNRPLTKTV